MEVGVHFSQPAPVLIKYCGNIFLPDTYCTCKKWDQVSSLWKKYYSYPNNNLCVVEKYIDIACFTIAPNGPNQDPGGIALDAEGHSPVPKCLQSSLSQESK